MTDPTFEKATAVQERPLRTAALVAWFQGLYEEPEEAPILVGGGAVELYSGGAYLTGDLDFVGRVPESVELRLLDVGFRKVGRHWIHEATQVFIELPGRSLDAGERAVELVVGAWTIRIASPEDVLVDRLAAWKHWNSSVDGASAFWLWRRQEPGIDLDRLRERARREHVADALDDLRRFARSLVSRPPTEEELREWANRNV